MEQIGDLARQLTETRKPGSAPSANYEKPRNASEWKPPSWVIRFWTACLTRYGSRLTSQFPTEAAQKSWMREMQRELEPIGAKRIVAGWESWDGQFPPGSREFRNHCLGKEPNWQHRNGAYKLTKRKALPRITHEESRQFGIDAFTEIRETLT